MTTRQVSFFVASARMMRAILSATATSILGLRASILASHGSAVLAHRWRTTVMAPVIRRRRRSRWPIFDILPSRGLPPVVCWRGASQAARSRPRRKLSIDGAKAWKAIAAIAPEPSGRFLVFARSSAELLVQGVDLRVETGDLLEQNTAQLANRLHKPGSSTARASRLA